MTDRTWVITECRNKEGFFLEKAEVLSEVRMNFWTLKNLVFLSFFITELPYLVDIFSPCSKDDCVGSLFRTYLHRSILWFQHLYFLIKYFNFFFLIFLKIKFLVWVNIKSLKKFVKLKKNQKNEKKKWKKNRGSLLPSPVPPLNKGTPNWPKKTPRNRECLVCCW